MNFILVKFILFPQLEIGKYNNNAVFASVIDIYGLHFFIYARGVGEDINDTEGT